MGKVGVVLVVLVVLVGGGAWLATQPAAGVQAVQPSSAAVIRAEAKIFAAFATAGARAVLTRQPVQARTELTDEELTSLVDSRLAQNPSSVSNVILVGSAEGVFKTTADVDWNGWTFHVYATGAVSFASDNSIHLDVHEADVGRLPLPSSVVDAIVAQNAAAATVNVPPGVSDLSLQPEDGGAVLSGMVSPSVRGLAPSG
jgi:hypothetical protein